MEATSPRHKRQRGQGDEADQQRPVAVEAVLTSSGTIVGPFMSELTGHRQLTPYRGGWCGNEMYPEVLNEDLRRKAGNLVGRLGDRLGS
jgi:hypothetical protein